MRRLCDGAARDDLDVAGTADPEVNADSEAPETASGQPVFFV
jgi:hypothetical protein